MKNTINQHIKRSFDITLSALAIIILSPILLIVALAIKLQDGGNVLYTQPRGGQYGKAFNIYKFRSMKLAKKTNLKHTSVNDERVTTIGKLIRKTSIDELPQLFNVLLGDMSIVGPRPHMIEHDNMYAAQIKRYNQRFAVKPGITGLAQIRGFRGNITKVDDMRNRVINDIEYINQCNFMHDIKIMAMTVPAVILGTNAY